MNLMESLYAAVATVDGEEAAERMRSRKRTRRVDLSDGMEPKDGYGHEPAWWDIGR